MPAEIVLLVERYPELTQTFVVSEARSLADLGVQARIEAIVRPATPNPEASAFLPVAYAEDDSRWRRLSAMVVLAARHPWRCLEDLVRRRRWRREEDVAPLRVLAPIARRIRSSGARHIHAHFATRPALEAMRIARIEGLTWSFVAHGYDIYRWPANLPEKIGAAAFVATPSAHTSEHLRGVAPEAETEVHDIVMGVDVQRFTRALPYPGSRTLLAVGRLVEKKGFAHLLEAVALLEADAPVERVTVIGEGPLRDELERQRSRLGLDDRVDFAGALPPDDVRAALETADLLVTPCVVAADGDRDSMPVVVKEALAMEVPVVASDAVGLPEVVGEGWGRLVPPGDPAALAEAIRELLALPAEERRAMGAAGRAHVSEHADVRTETAKLVELIRRQTARA